jgi:diacylglycerol kinase
MISVKRLFKSFTYAGRGLAKTWREEQNLQIHTVSALVAVALGYVLQISRIEWLVLILTILLVVLMEIVNSAVERVTDILKPRIHGYVKEIKDIMAAAVMLASIGAFVVGLLIFGPPILALLQLAT